MIDDVDREIIRHLQGDGRMPYSQLAQHIGLSDAAARQRVNRLTERGVIDIVAVTDPVTIGLGYQALLGLTVSGDSGPIVERVGVLDDAVYVVVTAGRYDVIAELVCVDTDTFLTRLNEIRTIDGVEGVEVIPYLSITKQTYDWGVG